MMMPDWDAEAGVLADTYGEYALARLGAKKELKALHDAFQNQQEVLRKKAEAQRVLERGVQHAMAARDEADMVLDDAVRRLCMAILSAHRNSRKSPEYLKYFPKGLTAVTLAPLSDELISVGKILDLLASEPDTAVKSFETAIREGAASLQNAMALHQGAEAAAGNAGNATRAQALLWRDGYRKTYGELLALYPSDKPYAESFFKKASKPKKPSGPPPAAQA